VIPEAPWVRIEPLSNRTLPFGVIHLPSLPDRTKKKTHSPRTLDLFESRDLEAKLIPFLLRERRLLHRIGRRGTWCPIPVNRGACSAFISFLLVACITASPLHFCKWPHLSYFIFFFEVGRLPTYISASRIALSTSRGLIIRSPLGSPALLLTRFGSLPFLFSECHCFEVDSRRAHRVLPSIDATRSIGSRRRFRSLRQIANGPVVV